MNQYNVFGRRMGYWETYHMGGTPYSKGNYIDGKPVGYWEYFWNNGKLKSKEYYT